MIKQTLYFGNPARLRVKDDQLMINLSVPDNDSESTTITRPLEDIGIVILDSPQIILTAPVLQKLVASGAAILSCDESHMPSGLMLPMEGNSLQSDRFKVQLSASLPLKKQMWQQTVKCKIRNQCSVLEGLVGKRQGNMRAWIGAVKSGDSENLEGRAAAYYWKEMLATFPGVTRRRDGESPNDLLNYGYAILRAIIARSLVSTGLHPTLGIFHHNQYNAYCLADDVMEPYRPYVDRLVIELCKEYDNPSLANKDVKRKILTVPTIEVNISNKRRPLMVAAIETTTSIYKCYAGETRLIRYPEMPI